MTPPARRWLSIDEAAELLGVSSKTAYRWAISGDLPALRIRHTLRIDGAALEEISTAGSKQLSADLRTEGAEHDRIKSRPAGQR